MKMNFIKMYHCLPLSPLKSFLLAVLFPESSVWFLLLSFVSLVPLPGNSMQCQTLLILLTASILRPHLMLVATQSITGIALIIWVSFQCFSIFIA